MKTKIKQQDKAFSPVKIEFTLETIEEVKYFAGLFNNNCGNRHNNFVECEDLIISSFPSMYDEYQELRKIITRHEN